LADSSGASQPLLIPITLELGPRELAVASDHAHELEALGFQLEEFGPRSLRVVSAPAETPPGRIAATVEELVTALGDLRGGDAKRIAAATLACHSAVRFGDRLEGPEQRFLLEELERAEDAVTCPHGRPTRLVVEWQELKRRFRRNY
jgi:DNA mismatch repair protein MutL